MGEIIIEYIHEGDIHIERHTYARNIYTKKHTQRGKL